MLDYIRSNAQSFGVKVAFAIIILVFMFWGVGSLTDGGSSNVVAKVNGEAITAQQFEQAYQRAAEYAMRNDPSLTREALVQQKLGRQVLNEWSPSCPRSRTPRASSIPRPTSATSKLSA